VTTTTTTTLFREPPPTASGQRQTVLRLLREAARSGQGVSGDTLRREYLIPQAPARIWELKNDFGVQIETRQDRTTRMATYYFRGDPPPNWKPPAKQGRFRLSTSFQQRRREEEARAMPLFARVSA